MDEQLEMAEELEGATGTVTKPDGTHLSNCKIYIGRYEEELIPYIKHNGVDKPVIFKRLSSDEISVKIDPHAISYERGVLGDRTNNDKSDLPPRDIICLSGGKDSTALAIYMADKLDEVEYVFCDTGREPPELYDFLEDLEDFLGQEIKWLNGGWHCKECDETGTKPDATECPECGGEIRIRDFDYYLERWSDDKDGKFLPGVNSRWCTKSLKILPFERYLRGDASSMSRAQPANVYIGLRADEDREGNYGDYENVNYIYPFEEDGLVLEDIMSILENAGLELPGYYDWRSTGGCYMCPFQRISDWKGLEENHPELFEHAKKEEEEGGDFTWNATRTLQEISDMDEIPEEWDKEEELILGDSCTICGK